MNNINFEMAIQNINLEQYDKAVEFLKTAIIEEQEAGNEKIAMEYTCVLGELYADLGRRNESITEFIKVLEFDKKNNSIPQQAKIAREFLEFFRGEMQVVTAEAPKNLAQMQTKAFVNRHQRGHKR